MRKTLGYIDYVTKDYEGFRQLMIDLIPQLTPEWTDTSQSDFGIVLVELLAYGLDILSYYQDKAVNENLLSTATLRSSVERLAKFLGYKPVTQTPSRVMVTFKKFDDLLNEEVTVPKGIKVSTKEDEIIFETEEELVIPAGKLTGKVSCIQGETITDELIGVSTGEPNQEFRLALDNVIEGTVEIRVETTENTGEIWEEVENFLDSDMSSTHYVVERRGDYSYIVFGSGSAGKIPPINSQIYATYRVGGGTIGNVGTRTITELYDDFVDGIEEVYNEEVPYEKGTDVEDIERIRQLAPKVFSTNNRAVTCRDFEALAEKVKGVYRAKGQEFAGENGDKFYLYIIPTTFDNPSEELKQTVLEYLENRRMVNVIVEIQNPHYIDFTLKLDLKVEEGYSSKFVAEELKDLIMNSFSIDNLDFSERIELMDILYLAKEVEGVKSLNLASDCVLPDVGDYEIIRLQDVVINIVN